MEIKDIAVQAECMDEVRGGGNTVANTFVGGNASSSLSIGGRRLSALKSPIDVAVSTFAANEVYQSGSIVDTDIRKEYWSIADSMKVRIRS